MYKSDAICTLSGWFLCAHSVHFKCVRMLLACHMHLHKETIELKDVVLKSCISSVGEH